MRTLFSDGSITETTCGYSRAVRAGNFVSVAGTTAMGPDGVAGGSDSAAQTREVLNRIRETLAEVGCGLSDVIRTRIFVTDIRDWRTVGAVHREFFADILPATTIVEVARLFDDRLLIEIEADAVITDG